MTGRFGSRDLRDLVRLTRVREQAALAEQAAVAARMKRVEARIAELRQQPRSMPGPDEARFLARWLVWRDNALKCETTRLAALRAEQRQTAIRCGRAVAENAVVERLLTQAAAEERRDRERRAALTFPGERSR